MTAVADPAISFFVRGRPQTKGSLHPWHKWRADGRCITGLSEQSGAELAEWRDLIATAARRSMREAPPFSGPLAVELQFYFPAPKKQLRFSPYVFTAKRWDIDKLTRAVLDALTDAAVWKDDSQVAMLHALKRYADSTLPPGVAVLVVPMEAP